MLRFRVTSFSCVVVLRWRWLGERSSKKGIKRVIFPSLGLRLREMKTLVGVRAYKNKCKKRAKYFYFTTTIRRLLAVLILLLLDYFDNHWVLERSRVEANGVYRLGSSPATLLTKSYSTKYVYV